MLFPTDKIFEKEQQKIFFSRLFRRIFLDDWLMKLIALVITFALWLGVSGLRAPKTVKLQNVALSMGISSDIQVTNSPVQEVDLIVTGDKRKIDLINPRDLVVSLDLTNVKPGDSTVQLSPQNVTVELPAGVKLEEIQPSKIPVKLEKVEEREVPVKAETEGNVAEGFEIYSETVSPAKIRVRGPVSFIKSLDFVSTEKIDMKNRREDFTATQVPLNVVNPKATLLNSTVDVIFNIGEKRIERLYIVPVETEKGTRNATVVLYGPRSIFTNIRSDSLKVEITKAPNGQDSLNLFLPPEIQDKVEIRRLKINP